MERRPPSTRLPGSSRGRSRKKSRSYWGDGPTIDLVHKLATLVLAPSTFTFAVWVYFHSVGPVFQKQAELDTTKLRAAQLASEIADLKHERAVLEQRLETFQRTLILYRRGVVLSWLSELRAVVRQNSRSTNLHQYALERVATRLQQLGPVEKGDPRLEALEFFRQFVNKNVPRKSTDIHRFDLLLEQYDQQTPAPPP